MCTSAFFPRDLEPRLLFHFRTRGGTGGVVPAEVGLSIIPMSCDIQLRRECVVKECEPIDMKRAVEG
jgi:hypothetical protein